MNTNNFRTVRRARIYWSGLVIVVLAVAGQGTAVGQVDRCPELPSVHEWPGTVPLDGGEYRVFSDAYDSYLSRNCGAGS